MAPAPGATDAPPAPADAGVGNGGEADGKTEAIDKDLAKAACKTLVQEALARSAARANKNRIH